MPNGKKQLLGSKWQGILDYHNSEQVARYENYLGIGLKNNRMAVDSADIRGIISLTDREKHRISSEIKRVADRCGLFNKSFSVRFNGYNDGTLMTWNEKDNTLIISTTEYKINNGMEFCATRQLLSAIEKLSKKKSMTFYEEYAIESLFHENVHSKATKKHPILKGTLDEIISETCTQLYAREKYVSILEKYGVKSENFDTIKYSGLGYRRECNILRSYFENDGKMQVGELINIANETESGVKIMLKKFKKRGMTEKEARRYLIELFRF